MIRQPFSPLLLVETAQNEYKRIASSSAIVTCPVDGASSPDSDHRIGGYVLLNNFIAPLVLNCDQCRTMVRSDLVYVWGGQVGVGTRTPERETSLWEGLHVS